VGHTRILTSCSHVWQQYNKVNFFYLAFIIATTVTVKPVFDDSLWKWLFLLKIEVIPKWELQEMTSCMKATRVTWDMASVHIRYVMTPTKDYGYAECEY
jgi:hypothetical protein